MSRPSLAAVAAVSVSVIALAACGKVLTVTPTDAAPRSDSTHAPDAPSRGMVSVQLLDLLQGSAVVGAQVVFTDAEQTQRGVTDGSGVATALMVDGGTVTTIGPDTGASNSVLLQTLFGVKSGDQIVLGVPNTPSTVLGAFTVDFTPVSGQGSANVEYDVFGPCGSTGTTLPGTATSASVTLNFSSSCSENPMELLVVGTNETTGAKLGFVDAPSVPFVANGTTTIAGPFQPLLSVTSVYTDAAQVTNVDVDRDAPDDFGFVSGGTGTIANGTTSVTVTGPGTSSAVIESDCSRAGFGTQSVLEHVPGNATSYALDVGATVLAWIGPPTFDQTTETAHVPTATDDAGSDEPDLFFVNFDYERPAAGDAGVTGELRWLAFSGTPGDLVMPQLPNELAAYLPAATDTQTELNTGEFDSDQVTGYDQARLDPYALLSSASARGVTTKRRFSEESGVLPVVRPGVSPSRSSRPTFRRDAARAR